jgi:hypothetical protein
MRTQTLLILVVTAIVAAGLVTLIWDRFFSVEARHRRRRAKNYGPVKDRRNVPAVQLNAKGEKQIDRK